MQISKNDFHNVEQFKDFINEHINDSFEDEHTLDNSSSNTSISSINEFQIISYINLDNMSSYNMWEEEFNGKIEIFSSKQNYEEIMKNANKSKKLFYFLDKYEHGNVHYSVASTSGYPDQQFDVSHNCGIFIPPENIQKEYKKMKRKIDEVDAFKHFIKDSNALLNEYSDWCNGEVYSVNVIVYDKDGKCVNESIFDGVIGFQQAQTLLNETVNNYAVELETNKLMQEICPETKNIKEIKDLSFNVKKLNLVSLEYLHLYDQHFAIAKYNNNEGTIYQYKENDIKPTIIKFNSLPEDVDLDALLKNELNFRIKKLIQQTLKESLNKDNVKKMTV